MRAMCTGTSASRSRSFAQWMPPRIACTLSRTGSAPGPPAPTRTVDIRIGRTASVSCRASPPATLSRAIAAVSAAWAVARAKVAADSSPTGPNPATMAPGGLAQSAGSVNT